MASVRSPGRRWTSASANCGCEESDGVRILRHHGAGAQFKSLAITALGFFPLMFPIGDAAEFMPGSHEPREDFDAPVQMTDGAIRVLLAKPLHRLAQFAAGPIRNRKVANGILVSTRPCDRPSAINRSRLRREYRDDRGPATQFAEVEFPSESAMVVAAKLVLTTSIVTRALAGAGARMPRSSSN